MATTSTDAPHPRSAAAMLRTAEAHELAARVLSRRNPVAAKAHADVAAAFRKGASPSA